MIKLDNILKEKIDSFFHNTDPIMIVKSFEKMGYEFEDDSYRISIINCSSVDLNEQSLNSFEYFYSKGLENQFYTGIESTFFDDMHSNIKYSWHEHNNCYTYYNHVAEVLNQFSDIETESEDFSDNEPAQYNLAA